MCNSYIIEVFYTTVYPFYYVHELQNFIIKKSSLSMQNNFQKQLGVS